MSDVLVPQVEQLEANVPVLTRRAAAAATVQHGKNATSAEMAALQDKATIDGQTPAIAAEGGGGNSSDSAQEGDEVEAPPTKKPRVQSKAAPVLGSMVQ
jgi:hypothetical protein